MARGQLPENARVRWSSRLGWMIYYERKDIPFCEGPFPNEHAACVDLIARTAPKLVGTFGPRRRAWGRPIAGAAR